MSSPITVLGAGSFGTALAIHLARNQQAVNLWGHRAEHIETMQKNRCNTRYLPNIPLPDNITLHTDLKSALHNVHDILIVVPSHAFRETLTAIKPFLTKKSRIISASKGLDPKTHQLLHLVIQEITGDIPFAVLSGPSFATEIAQGLPTATALASTYKAFTQDLIKRFHTKLFRVYHTTDIIGVELGGAMKNVFAIAVGIANGLQLGTNTSAAIVTRGLAEMVRLGLAIGARQETFMGLAGIGDMVLTCMGNYSRNRRLGFALGEGKSIATARQEIGQIIEGIQAAAEINLLAKQLHVEVPITEQVYQVLHQNLTPEEAVNNLLEREPKAEGL